MERDSLQKSAIDQTQRYFRHKFGYAPDLAHPKTFNEHINSYKLFGFQEKLTTLADKFAVRAYVAERIGENYLTKLYYVGDEPSAEAYAALPNSFVVKATHGSGMSLLVKDKSAVKRTMVLFLCRKWLQEDHSEIFFELCYKDIPRRILIEEFLAPELGAPPSDYKFFCFHGVPKVIQLDVDRFSAHKRNLYDTNWQRLPVQYLYPNTEEECPAPLRLQEMLHVAEVLSQELEFIRVDLYEVGNRVVFGELTNYPEAGFGTFEPAEYDLIMGSYWSRP